MTQASSRRGRFLRTTVLALALAALMALPSLASAAPVEPLGASPSTTGNWTYGATKTIDASGLARNGTYQITATFGYQVQVQVNQSSGGNVALYAQRVMGAAFQVTYCVPTCTHPQATSLLAYHAAEELQGFSNFTENGTVSVGGVPTRAISLVNSVARLRAGAFENDTVVVHGLLATHTASMRLSVALVSRDALNFTPALGLVPVAPTVGESWGSTAMYAGSSSWTTAFNYTRTTLNGTYFHRAGANPGSVPLLGSVTLNGTDLGTVSLTDVASSQRIGLDLTGGLHLREGFLPIPSALDLFGGSPAEGAPVGNSSLGASFAALDFAGQGSRAPLGFTASSAVFNTASSNPEETLSSVGGLQPASTAPNVESSGPIVLQAEPESSSTWQAQSHCLLNGTCSTTTSPGTAPLRGGLLAGLGVVVLAVIVATVLVARRPRTPLRPNAELYPPVGPAARTAAGPGKSPAPPTKPEEPEDPLGHLW